MKYIRGYKTSSFQRRLWFLYKLKPKSPFLNNAFIFKINAQLDNDFFSRAIKDIISRHEILRTNIVEAKGEPIQVIYKVAETGLEIIDLSRRQPRRKEKLADEIMEEISSRSFKLESGPLYRFRLIKLAENQYYFLFVLHCIIADSWSITNILYKELILLYQAYINNQSNQLPPLEIQFKDYAEWEQSKRFQKKFKNQEKRWPRQLSGELPALSLPVDKTRVIQLGRSSHKKRPIDLGKKLSGQLLRLSEQRNMTLCDLLMSSLVVFLHKISNQTDVFIGAYFLGRGKQSLENLAGPLSSILPIRSRFSPETSFVSLAKQIKRNIFHGLENKNYFFKKNIQPRDLSQLFLARVVFCMIQADDYVPEDNAKNKKSHFETEVSCALLGDVKVDLEFRYYNHINSKKITMVCAYNADLFYRETIKRWLVAHKQLLREIVADPESRISKLGMFTSKEKHFFLSSFSNTRACVLDSHLNLQPIGVPGEIYISGEGLTRDSFNRFQKTKEIFLSHPFFKRQRIYKTGDMGRMLPDGNIEYIGRVDQQVKIRGNLINLSQIEAILVKHPRVKRCVVVVKKNKKTKDKYLVAYYVSIKPMAVFDLRQHLKIILPDYMIPSCFIYLKRIPLTASGETDCLSLPESQSAYDEAIKYKPPLTRREKQLARIWQKNLNLKRISVNHNFFDLGGHSLRAVKVISQMNQVGLRVSLADLFRYPTIGEMATYIRQYKKFAKR